MKNKIIKLTCILLSYSVIQASDINQQLLLAATYHNINAITTLLQDGANVDATEIGRAHV